jgi:bifunctional non-homologous end joining protein LigD
MSATNSRQPMTVERPAPTTSRARGPADPAPASRKRTESDPRRSHAQADDDASPRSGARRAGRKEVPAEVVAGVRITHPERVIFPEAGITKLDLARYYAGMAAYILPFVRMRPLSLVRCPQGPAGACFFQKHATEREIPGITYAMITESNGEKPYVLANTAKALAGLAQMGTLELHGWNASADNVECADLLVFDFDPDPALPFGAVAAAALQCRGVLSSLGLESYAKTTGGKGLHVVVPLTRRVPWDTAKRFAKAIAEHLALREPQQYTLRATKALRKGRIFIDYLRNARGATAVAPFSVRARPHAPVALPLYWNEVNDRLDPGVFTLATIEDRLARRGDPWAGYRTHRQTITVEMQRQLARAA